MSNGGQFELSLADSERGLAGSDARVLIDAIAGALGERPRLSARALDELDVDGWQLASQDAVYELIRAGFTPAAVAAATAAAIRQVASLLSEFLRQRASRRIEVVRPDGTHIIVQGSQAKVKLLTSLIEPDGASE